MTTTPLKSADSVPLAQRGQGWKAGIGPSVQLIGKCIQIKVLNMNSMFPPLFSFCSTYVSLKVWCDHGFRFPYCCFRKKSQAARMQREISFRDWSHPFVENCGLGTLQSPGRIVQSAPNSAECIFLMVSQHCMSFWP